MDDYLFHYGTPRHSGRYPWGSGKDPYQHGNGSFLATVKYYRDKGLSDTEIAKTMGMSSTDFKKKYTNENQAQKAARNIEWQRLKDKGWSYVAIGERYGVNESTVRSALENSTVIARYSKTEGTAQMLKDRLEEHAYIDITKGSEQLVGVTPGTWKNAIQKLQEEGYEVIDVTQPQVSNPSQNLTFQVLAKPGTTYKEVKDNKDQIALITDYQTVNDGKSWLGIERPVSIDASRIAIRYADEQPSGEDKDGVIEIRPGVEDLSLGRSNYAQVRIAVNDSHYLKGMAIYSDDLPDGIDILFNTNKSSDTPMLGPKDNTVLKPLKKDKETGEVDWANPFGSLIKIEDGQIVGQHHYIDINGEDKLSAVNIVKEAGDWNEWSKSLSSQFLSKQYEPTIKRQLDLAFEVKQDQFDEIMSLTNPEIKRKLLEEFADECDSAAVHLKAAAMPRQTTKVLLPVPDLKDGECYAPTYKDGEQLALIRYPHAGPFEIPVLTVHNSSEAGKKIVGADSIDAIGINPKAAAQLSGADFDGDTVVVIPTKGQKLKTSPPLDALKDFNPSRAYPAYEGMPEVSEKTGFRKPIEMGKVSNLITDMTIKGASDDEIARAVKHSMVVIDAEKHNLNWKQSYIDNGIAELRMEYQGKKGGGASTLISQASHETQIPERKAGEFRVDPETGSKKLYYIDPDTGDKLFRATGKTIVKRVTDDKGNVSYVDTGKLKTVSSSRMADTKDAYTLSSGTRKENMYAEYANNLKALGNVARKTLLTIGRTKQNTSARIVYGDEVNSLMRKLQTALANRPRERQAQLIANKRIDEKIKSSPEIKNDKDAVKKLRTEALAAARHETGASKRDSVISITDREWEAILAGAISSTKISEILENANSDQVKALATPKNNARSLTSAQIRRIQTLSNNGKTLDEIANTLGISPTTVYRTLNE